VWIRVTLLPVDKNGLIDPDDLLKAITGKTCLVSIMSANNEIGTIQPLAKLAAIAKERGVLFHTDAVQAAGKIQVDVEALGVDFLSLSAHKIHGPKGTVRFTCEGTAASIHSYTEANKSAYARRHENVAGIAGFGRSAELAVMNLPAMERITEMRNRIAESIMKLVLMHGLMDT